MGTKKILASSTLFLWSILLAASINIQAGEKVCFFEQPKSKEWPKLRILTINVWSGLNYVGILRMRDYETKENRNARFRLLVKQVKEIQPDIIFIQEANPAAKYSRKLARALGFKKIHQVCIGGIKLGPLGVPTNLKEGNAILTRPGLHLKKYDVWNLKGYGIFGDLLTFHLSEGIFALVGKIVIEDTPIYLVSVHLTAAPALDEVLLNKFDSVLEKGEMTAEEYKYGLRICREKNIQREKEIKKLIKKIGKLPEDAPIILAGDFNARPGSSVVQLLKTSKNGRVTFFDTFDYGESKLRYSWDPQTNVNVQSARRIKKYPKFFSKRVKYLISLFLDIRQRIDYIFLSRHFDPGSVCDSRIVLDTIEDGVQVSDHYGVFSEIRLESVLKTSPKETKFVQPMAKSRFEFLPIFMWDTDIGYGYGIKMFYLNPFKLDESFDVVLFNSSKGERWYRFVFSWPDFQRRQGKIYPLSLDLTIEYDKWIKNNFFGIGNESKFADREYYTREPFDINMVLSRGFSTKLVGQVGVRYKTINNSNFEADSRLFDALPALSRSRATYTSVFSNLRYDTRDNFINPSRGLMIQGEAEFTLRTKSSNVKFNRISASLFHYSVLFYPKTVLALRFGIQGLFGEDLPVQVLLPVGGNSTLRGYPQDRFLGKSSALFNAELRFPVFWRIGGVVGFDAGKVWDSLGEFDLTGWATNFTIGLRLYMNNFLARFDIGFGRDYTGVYFSFGHIF